MNLFRYETTIEELRAAARLADSEVPAVVETTYLSSETKELFQREAESQGYELYFYSRGVRIWAPARNRRVA